ncbi:MAG: hypothetical protein ACM3X7_09565 [Solirubrobacterales bacterium]
MLLMKVVFNLTYITAAWILVAIMHMRKNLVGYKDRFSTKCIYASFIILALSETFIRLCSTFQIIPGVRLMVMGISSTLFITGLLFAYKYHFNLSFGFFQFILLIMAVVRLITLVFPGDKVEIQGNIIFIFFGLGVSMLILRESFQRSDLSFIGTGTLLLFSILFTLPSMLFSNDTIITLLFSVAAGLSDLSIGFLLLKDLFRRSGINMVKFR